jgi:RHH-type transcriptional regulator, proline utilization regulon repressor / proline dehydrogenase / delta 1-pyrroline-5-carboxylate dehydrogenase
MARSVLRADGCARLRGAAHRDFSLSDQVFRMLPERPVADAIRAAFVADEVACVQRLLPLAALPPDASARVSARARGWVEAVRAHQARNAGMESFLQQYDLGTQEGVLLMCVAEALLRIPDAGTADRLIRDKLGRGDWQRHLGQSQSLLVNASTWGLMLTGKLTLLDADSMRDPAAWYERIVARAGEPVVRLALRQAMKLMAEQFVMGRSIGEALARSHDDTTLRYSYDMLGESALTTAGARAYQAAYADAIATIGGARELGASAYAQPSISVKLSALHPRYEFGRHARVLAELVPALLELCRIARDHGIGLTVDAEEAERLELSLEIFARVRRDEALAGWDGLGLAVQAYQKRALAVIDWLTEFSREGPWRIPLRLVKGAYWDSEIKRAQVQGLDGYPVFTRKSHTDVSYLACARRMLAARGALYPMFATHNAQTASAIVEYAAERHVAHSDFEFQRLHGMGEALHAQIVRAHALGIASRVYAPVGSHQDLLPYLVRRLLENGANTSFVNRIADPKVAIDTIVADPVARVRAHGAAPNPVLPLPRDLYAPERVNSRGVSLADQPAMAAFAAAFAARRATRWTAAPLIAGKRSGGGAIEVFEPAHTQRALGSVVAAGTGDIESALAAGVAAQPAWDALGGAERANVLDCAAAAIEQALEEFVVLLAREAGKARADAISEVREAADFCRYYAALARRQFTAPLQLPSPTGESNVLSLHGRGVFACISPWNFPLAIFVGQTAAALAAGNAVAAKPAEQTPLVAARAVELLQNAGVPPAVLALLPGTGEAVGAALVNDARIAGVAFTGSTEVARAIALALARRSAIVPFIAETGGMNALIVDSSALPEQVVVDAIASGFNSAGQRCSALRVLFLQEEIAPRVIELLEGAMAELVVGDAEDLATDVGPVIDGQARATLEAHVAAMASAGRLRYRVALPAACDDGIYVAPTLIELESIAQLEREVFGPVLHVVRYRADALDAVVDSINATGYGLTLGIHSRIDETVRSIAARVRVGNVYVNRNIIGAVVGVQPFGGEGLSGTGPKAGGPHYLPRFAVERTLTVNTAAAGGNATLLAQSDSEGEV